MAVQGTHGSFHEMAAQRVFKETDFTIVTCDTFRDVFEAVQHNRAQYGVVAIENSLHGSINAVYKLLAKSSLFVCAEVRLPIELYLIGHQNVTLETLQSGTCEVVSQQEALSQCQTWIAEHLPRAQIVEFYDTAAAVANVMNDSPHRVAVASKAAAAQYNGHIIAGSINDEVENYTRFFVITTSAVEPASANRTSIILEEHTDQAGGLYAALGLFAQHDVNLSKLHSQPIAGRKRLYTFYIDFDISASQATAMGIFKALQQQGWKVTILGSYVADDLHD